MNWFDVNKQHFQKLNQKGGLQKLILGGTTKTYFRERTKTLKWANVPPPKISFSLTIWMLVEVDLFTKVFFHQHPYLQKTCLNKFAHLPSKK